MSTTIKGLAGWTRNSFIDFPGTVATVLFYSGCNLRCPYCFNAQLVLSPPDCSDVSDEVWEFLEKRKNLIKGVVITGGEPTLHPLLDQTVSEIRRLGYLVKLDTNGLMPDQIKKISPDYLALDIKTDPALYQTLLKSPYPDTVVRINESLEMVKLMKEKAEVRITMAPRLITRQIISRLGEWLYGVERVFLQPMTKRFGLLDPPFFNSMELMTSQEMEEYRGMLSPYVGTCILRDQVK